jgi:hypothetical protein
MEKPMIARDEGINLCVATMREAGDFSAQCNGQRRLASILRECGAVCFWDVPLEQRGDLARPRSSM